MLARMPPVHLLSRSIALIALLLVTIGLAWVKYFDAEAERNVDAGLKRALASFAAARTLNAVISVAKGTQVAVQPAGFGLTLTPGQALEPIDDLVEQFAALMLAATVAFGIQKILIAMGAHWLFSLLLTGVACLWAWWLFRPAGPPRRLTFFLIALLFVRFSVPVVTIGSDLVFETFMAKTYEKGQAGVSTSAEQLTSITAPTVEAPVAEGMSDRIKRWWSSTSDNFNVRARFEQLRDFAERSVEHIVHLIVVFVMQTMILPLLLLWGLGRAAALLYRGAGMAGSRTPHANSS